MAQAIRILEGNRVSLGHDVVLKDLTLFDRLTSKVYLQNSKIGDHTDTLYNQLQE